MIVALHHQHDMLTYHEVCILVLIGVDYRDRLCVCRRIGKEPVLPAHHERFYAALSTVIAQLQTAILQITY